MNIAIIGAGWYGCHIALALKEKGHNVTVFEKNSDIFQQISGNFGIRLHGGAHYPRSPATRKSCLNNFQRFKDRYPDLVVDHEYSIYALGKKDVSGQPSHVEAQAFDAVCREFPGTQQIDTEHWGYQELLSAYTMEEPSIKVGEPLREAFRKRLRNAEIPVNCNCAIEQLEQRGDGVLIRDSQKGEYYFDKVINATSYQSLLPIDRYPFDIEIIYQVCLGLLYEDKTPHEKPFSMIVMDGLYPCLMPYLNTEDASPNTFIMTHGLYTIMSSNKKLDDAKKIMDDIDENFIESAIRPHCEKDMNRFWQEFSTRFTYKGWKQTILAKLKTQSEYRSALTFEKDNIIDVVPGKVSNIFEVEDEVLELLNPLSKNILEHNGFHYVAQGNLDKGQQEITKAPEPNTRHTTNLQTYDYYKNQSFWQSGCPIFKQPSSPVSSCHIK